MKAGLAFNLAMSFDETDLGNRRVWLDQALRYGESVELYAERARLFERLANRSAAKRELDHAIPLATQDLAAVTDCDASSVAEARDRLVGLLAQRGMLAEQSGNLNSATLDLTEALRLSPSPNTHFLVGGLELLKDNDDAAEKEFNAALSLDPMLPTALRGRASINGKRGNWSAVIDDLTRSLVRDPHNPFTYVSRGAAYFWLENEDAGWQDIRSTLQYRSDPRFKSAFSGLSKGIGKPMVALMDQLQQGAESTDPAVRSKTIDLLRKLSASTK
jgi:tetratricopeptide (TPR) repeat protein